MPKSYTQLQQSLTFDELMKTLDERFRTIPDNRTGNARQYQLPDVLKAAFAMFSLKHPSLLDFKTQSTAEENNLHNIYRIEGNIPSDNQMRGILDPVDPQLLRPLFRTCFSLLSEAGVIGEYEYRDKHVIVSIDGVEHFSSTKVHCSSCTTRKHRNGEISYHHSGLAAVLVHPEQKEVFPLDFEPILNQDGAQKNDCERNAAIRLCKALNTRYPDLKIILVEDALYADAPHIRRITGYGWRYILNIKPDSHESLERQFAGRRASGQVKELRITDLQGIKHYFAWTNDLCLCESAIDVKVNYLLYEQTDKQGKITRWTWVTIHCQTLLPKGYTAARTRPVQGHRPQACAASARRGCESSAHQPKRCAANLPKGDLTSRHDLSALSIAILYKERWSIEKWWRWLKRTYKVEALLKPACLAVEKVIGDFVEPVVECPQICRLRVHQAETAPA